MAALEILVNIEIVLYLVEEHNGGRWLNQTINTNNVNSNVGKLLLDTQHSVDGCHQG